MPKPISWLLMMHQLPQKPDYLRVKIRRRLQGIGAVAVKNSVYCLPETDRRREDFQWLLKEIAEEGGEAFICRATFEEGLSDGEVVNLFKKASDENYHRIASECRELIAGETDVARLGQEAAKIRNRLTEIEKLDFFQAEGRRDVASAFREIEKVMMGEDRPEKKVGQKMTTHGLKGKVWVTRAGVHVDRIACAWLTRRFVDPLARFKFARTANYSPAQNEIRFDMMEAEFTHEGDRCSFETLRAKLGLKDRATGVIAEIVHDIDLKDEKFGHKETPGVAAMIEGVCSQTSSDLERIEKGSAILDVLYANFQREYSK